MDSSVTPHLLLHAPSGASGAALAEPLLARKSLLVTVTTDEAELLAHLPQADALLLPASTYSEKVAATLCHLSRLRWIQLLSAGYDNLSRLGLPPGLVVTNAGDSYSASVAEHAFGLLLALARQLVAAVQSTGTWKPELAGNVTNLAGKTLVIVGYGSIGREIAVRARAFDMRIVAVRRSTQSGSGADIYFSSDSLVDALALGDAVVLTAPYDSRTHRLMCIETLRACKRGAFLINVARGGLVDHLALAQVLQDGHLGGAALDVTDPEPLPLDAPLWDCPNLLITPHIGGVGAVSQRRLISTVLENVQLFCDGQPLMHQVKP